MTSQEIVKDSVSKAFEVLEALSPTEYHRLQQDVSRNEHTRRRAIKTIEEDLILSKKLQRQTKVEEIMNVVINHLPAEKVALIMAGFDIQTYHVYTVPSKEGYTFFVKRNGFDVFHPKAVLGLSDLEMPTWVQEASLLVEIILFILQVIGVAVELNKASIARIAEDVEPILKEPAMVKAFNVFKKAWEAAKGSKLAEAKSIFCFLKDSYSAGILWNTVKLILKTMPWYDYAESIVVVSAMLFAAFATDGLALIAKIVLALDSAYNIGKKFANLEKIESIKEELK